MIRELAEALIHFERFRQISEEGFTSEHDDAHSHGILEKAGDIYYHLACYNGRIDTEKAKLWPLSPNWLKPKGPMRDLIKAGALYLAEKDRNERFCTRETNIPSLSNKYARCVVKLMDYEIEDYPKTYALFLVNINAIIDSNVGNCVSCKLIFNRSPSKEELEIFSGKISSIFSEK